MPLITRPPAAPDRDTINVRLDLDLKESLRLYAEFLGSTRDYVIGSAVRRVVDRDREFLAWREARHGQPPTQTDTPTNTPAAARTTGTGERREGPAAKAVKEPSRG